MKSLIIHFLIDTIRNIFPERYYNHQIQKTIDTYSYLKKNADPSDIQSLVDSERYEIASLRYELDEFYSDSYLRLARKYKLLIPTLSTYEDKNEDWIESNYGPIILSLAGREKIKEEYREEIKFRQQRNTIYISIFFGIIGSITALLSVFYKK